MTPATPRYRPASLPATGLLAVRLGLVCLLASASSLAPARVIEADPRTYRERLSALKPGDTLQLSAGEYRDGLPVHRLVGTAEAPILIRGPAGAPPAVFIAQPRSNTVSIVDSAYVHVRDLTLDGRGIAVDAVKAEGSARWAHHITLENLRIVNHGAEQQIIGISTKAPAWGWVVRGNRIYGAGTGMYFGNSDGSAPFYDGLIENNLVVDPRGYAIQIKHQNARPSLDIAPRGRHVTIIRHNTLSKASGGSTGQLARPNLLLGHWPLSGEGAQDEYQVYGNYIADNPTEALLQAEGNVAIYANVLRNLSGPGIHVQPHNDAPRHVRILYNTVVTAGNPIVVRLREGDTGAYRRIVAGNAVFSPQPIQGGSRENNAAFGLEDAKELLGADARAALFDAYTRDERLRCARLDTTLLEGLSEGACDFNARLRAEGYCGAYAGRGANPGWVPRLDIKPKTACPAATASQAPR